MNRSAAVGWGLEGHQGALIEAISTYSPGLMPLSISALDGSYCMCVHVVLWRNEQVEYFVLRGLSASTVGPCVWVV
jgi:hypothetical protein